MRQVIDTIKRRGGIAATKELLAAGHSRGAIIGEVSSGAVFRIRKGWYADPSVGTDVMRAWRVGGRLDCLSAARHLGLWIPEGEELLHVSVPVTASRLRTPTNSRARLAESPDLTTRVHWTGESLQGDRVAVSPIDAISRVFRCCGPQTGFIVLESALARRKLRPRDMHELERRLSGAEWRWARFATEHSESGSESALKLMLLRFGIRFQQQVKFPGVGRVDFVIGEHLVIEADSKEHHSNPYADRKRDAALSALGKRVLRFMYSQLFFETASVESAILAALARLDHTRA